MILRLKTVTMKWLIITLFRWYQAPKDCPIEKRSCQSCSAYFVLSFARSRIDRIRMVVRCWRFIIFSPDLISLSVVQLQLRVSQNFELWPKLCRVKSIPNPCPCRFQRESRIPTTIARFILFHITFSSNSLPVSASDENKELGKHKKAGPIAFSWPFDGVFNAVRQNFSNVHR